MFLDAFGKVGWKGDAVEREIEESVGEDVAGELEGALRHGSNGQGIADADHLSRDSGGAALEVDDLLRGVDEAPLAACEGGEEGRPLCGGAEAGRTEGDEAFALGS